MFDYPVLQIVFAVYFMLIFSAFITAIGWCNPAEYKRRPALFGLSTVFTAFGIFSLVKITAICSAALKPGEDLMASVTNLFTAFYEVLSLNDYTKYASDQIGALVLAGIAIVFLVIAFLLSFVFTFTFFFRIALFIDLKLKNSVRYIIMAFCTILIIIIGVVSSQTLIMLLVKGKKKPVKSVRLRSFEKKSNAEQRAQARAEKARARSQSAQADSGEAQDESNG